MSGETQPSWSKWMIAMLIGFPAIGYAYYYMSKTTDKKKIRDKNSVVDIQASSDSKSKEDVKSNSIGTPSVVTLGPMDHALQLKENGNRFYKEGKFRDAVKCYTEAIELCPLEEKDNLSALFQNRAAAYEALGATEHCNCCFVPSAEERYYYDVIKYYTQAIQSYPDKAQLYENLAEAYEYLGNFEEVVKNCTEAIKLKPTYLKALHRRYKACEKIGQLRQSLEDITTCCYLQKFSNEDDIAVADRLLKKYGMEEAAKYVKNKSPTMPSKYFLRHYLNSLANDPIKDFLIKPEETEIPSKGIEAAKKALRESNYEDVFKGCDEEINLVKETPQMPSRKYYEALLLRGTMNVLINEAVLAMADLDSIIDSGDADTDLVVSALLKRACLHITSENVTKAFEDFDYAQRLLPNNSDVHHQKAQMLLLSDRIEEAIEEFEKAQSINPNFSVIQVQKYFTEYKYACEKKDKKKANSAKSALKDVLHKNPDVVEGYLLLSQIYNEIEEYAASELLMNAAIESDPTNANILVHRGILYLQWKGDVDNAVKDMEKAIEVDPKCGFAYETLASVEVQRGNLINGISLFEKALPLTKSIKEASHIISLKTATQIQHFVTNRLGSFLFK